MSNQNIFDNKNFFEGYRALRSTDVNYNDLLEQPAMRKLLPDLQGKAVLDLGCGYGRNCLEFVQRGAKTVVGVDISQKMLEVARKESVGQNIKYINMNMAEITKLHAKFDFIYSSLAFHYVEDFPAFAAEIYTSLNDGGHLLFSQEHPIVTATVGGKQHYNYDDAGHAVSFTFSDYGCSGKRDTFWFVEGVEKYHRTFGEIITALARTGFTIEVVEEPVPSPFAQEKLPSLKKEAIKPTFLIVKAKKT